MVDIIAEIGSSPATRGWQFESWCRVARLVGATHIKAQLWRVDHFPESERDAKRGLEFPRERLGEFVETAHRYGLKAGASVFDVEAVRLVAAHCDFMKLAAREQDNHGLAVIADQVAYGRHIPLYRSVTSSNGGVFVAGDAFPKQIIWLGVILQYPAPMVRSLAEVARWAWAYRGREYGLWGWSSHTLSALDCVVAARLGASVIEKHLALAWTDIEAGWSLMPSEFRKMTGGINR